MPEIRIITEVSGRVCAVPVQAGERIGAGDGVVLVEAMKMEIPAVSPAVGTVKSILVSLDEIVAEGQAVAILET